MLLNELPIGSNAVVSGFSELGLKHQTRYLSLGLMPGANITVQRVAPLGCPMQIKVGSTLLSIRRAEAQDVVVEVTA